MLATYHNHSTWSDGKASLEDLLRAAQAMNIGELGVSDHWVLHPEGKQFKWAMPTDRLPDYFAAMQALREQANKQGSTQVRIGLEVDWFPGHGLPLGQALSKFDFDYLIGSVHQITVPFIQGVGGFMIDGSPAAWEKITQEQRNQVHRAYWGNMQSLAESGLFDIVAHIDLAKKFAFYPTIDLSQDISAALDSIAKATTSSGDRLVVEINTAGWHKPCGDAYPSVEILRECRSREIPLTINADAHQPEHLLRDFDRAAQRLTAAGYHEVARFSGPKLRMERLSEATPTA